MMLLLMMMTMAVLLLMMLLICSIISGTASGCLKVLPARQEASSWWWRWGGWWSPSGSPLAMGSDFQVRFENLMGKWNLDKVGLGNLANDAQLPRKGNKCFTFNMRVCSCWASIDDWLLERFSRQPEMWEVLDNKDFWRAQNLFTTPRKRARLYEAPLPQLLGGC